MRKYTEVLPHECDEIFRSLLASYVFVIPYGEMITKKSFLLLLKQVYGNWKGRNHLFMSAVEKCDFKTIQRSDKIIIKN